MAEKELYKGTHSPHYMNHYRNILGPQLNLAIGNTDPYITHLRAAVGPALYPPLSYKNFEGNSPKKNFIHYFEDIFSHDTRKEVRASLLDKWSLEPESPILLPMMTFLKTMEIYLVDPNKDKMMKFNARAIRKIAQPFLDRANRLQVDA